MGLYSKSGSACQLGHGYSHERTLASIGVCISERCASVRRLREAQIERSPQLFLLVFLEPIKTFFLVVGVGDKGGAGHPCVLRRSL